MSLRAGIVGGGMIAAVHAAAIRAAGHEVVGVATRTSSGGEAAAGKLRARPFRDAHELIESDEVDVVHVCTPNGSHAEYVTRAAHLGKRIVCEKPLAVDLAEAQQLNDLAGSTGVQTAVPFVYRYYAAVREMRARIAAGPQPLLVRGSYLQDWLVDSREWNWRVNDTQGGASRAFADIGVHLCDFIEFVIGDRISRVVANTARAYPERNGAPVRTEDIASLLVQTEAGVTGTLTVSQVSHGHKNHLFVSVDTEDASYGFDQEDPEKLTVGTAAGITTEHRATAAFESAEAARVSFLPSGHPQGYQDAFNAFMSDAYATFEGQTVDALPDFADGLRAALLTEAVLASARTGAWSDVAGIAHASKAVA
ncbi:Gfo/Idh/MocA family protein [Microbacterium oxydans]|uniref:Gfo/Idh/MocA family protein n=1 Tax=Microbacterium oxydans TaxID=82380 RepID=UPI003672777A